MCLKRIQGFQGSQTSWQDMHEEDDANTYAKAHYARFRNTPGPKPKNP